MTLSCFFRFSLQRYCFFLTCANKMREKCKLFKFVQLFEAFIGGVSLGSWRSLLQEKCTQPSIWDSKVVSSLKNTRFFCWTLLERMFTNLTQIPQIVFYVSQKAQEEIFEHGLHGLNGWWEISKRVPRESQKVVQTFAEMKKRKRGDK